MSRRMSGKKVRRSLSSIRNTRDFWIEQELTPLEKQVMELHLTGMGYREIAKVLGRDGKSTDNALQRSRGKLRRALDKKTEQEKEVLRPSKGEE